MRTTHSTHPTVLILHCDFLRSPVTSSYTLMQSSAPCSQSQSMYKRNQISVPNKTREFSHKKIINRSELCTFRSLQGNESCTKRIRFNNLSFYEKCVFLDTSRSQSSFTVLGKHQVLQHVISSHFFELFILISFQVIYLVCIPIRPPVSRSKRSECKKSRHQNSRRLKSFTSRPHHIQMSLSLCAQRHKDTYVY
jgi:hypothetical protein